MPGKLSSKFGPKQAYKRPNLMIAPLDYPDLPDMPRAAYDWRLRLASEEQCGSADDLRDLRTEADALACRASDTQAPSPFPEQEIRRNQSGRPGQT